MSSNFPSDETLNPTLREQKASGLDAARERKTKELSTEYDHAVKQTVKNTLLALNDVLPYSEQAEELLFMITSHKTKNGRLGKRQITNDGSADGVARGLTQIEPTTAQDIWDRYLERPENKVIKEQISRATGVTELNLDDLENNDAFNIALARVNLFMNPEALPNNPEGMAQYASKYHNRGGAGTPEKYLNDYERYKITEDPPQPEERAARTPDMLNKESGQLPPEVGEIGDPIAHASQLMEADLRSGPRVDGSPAQITQEQQQKEAEPTQLTEEPKGSSTLRELFDRHRNSITTQADRKKQELAGNIPEPELPKERVQFLQALENNREETVQRLRVNPKSSLEELGQDKSLSSSEWLTVLLNSQEDELRKHKAKNTLELTALADRSGWGITKDIALDASAGLVDTVGGLAVAGAMANSVVNPIVAANRFLEGLGIDTGTLGKTAREVEDGTIKTAVEFAERLGESSEYLRDQRTNTTEAQSKLFEQAVGKLSADASIMEQVKTTLAAAKENPLVIASGASEMLPDLFTGGLIGFLSKKVGKSAAKELGESASQELAEKMASKNSQDVAEGILIAYNAGVEGGQAGKEAYTKIMEMDHAYLSENSPEYTQLRESGLTEAEAKSQLATNAGKIAFGSAALISGGASKVTGAAKVETSLGRNIPDGLKAAANKVQTGKRAVKAAGVVAGQAAEEFIQEGGAAASTNLGVKSVDESQNLTQDVGVQGTLGALVGGAVGGGLSVPSIIGGTAEDIKQLASTEGTRKAAQSMSDAQNAVELESEEAPELSPEDPKDFRNYSNPESEHYNPYRAMNAVTHPDYLSSIAEKPEKKEKVLGKALQYSLDTIKQVDQRIQENPDISETELRDLEKIKNDTIYQIDTITQLADALAQEKDSGVSLWRERQSEIIDMISSTETDISDDEIQSVFEYLGSDPESIPDKVFKAAESSSNEELRQTAKTIQESKQSLSEITFESENSKSMQQVRAEIMNGGPGMLGIRSYKKVLDTAKALKEPKLAEQYKEYLDRFVTRQQTKASEARYIYDEFRKPEEQRAADLDDRVEAFRQEFSPKDKKGNIKGKGTNLHFGTPESLVQSIELEAKALSDYRAVVDNTLGTKPISTVTETAETSEPIAGPVAKEDIEAVNEIDKKVKAKPKTQELKQPKLVEADTVNFNATERKNLNRNNKVVVELLNLTDEQISPARRKNLMKGIASGTPIALEKVKSALAQIRERTELAKDAERFGIDSLDVRIDEDTETQIQEVKGEANKAAVVREKAYSDYANTLTEQLIDTIKTSGIKPGRVKEIIRSMSPKAERISTQPEKTKIDFLSVKSATEDFFQDSFDKPKYKSNKVYRETYDTFMNELPNNRKIAKKTAPNRSFGKDLPKVKLSDMFNFGKGNSIINNDPELLRKLTTRSGMEEFIEEHDLPEETAQFFREIVMPFTNKFADLIQNMYVARGSTTKLMENPLQMFVDTRTNTVHQELVVAMALSTLAWLNNDAKLESFKSKQDLKTFFGLDDTGAVSSDMLRLVSLSGSNLQQAHNTIGMNVLNSLGLQAKKDTADYVSGGYADNVVTAIGQLAIDGIANDKLGLVEKRDIHSSKIEDARNGTPLEIDPKTGEAIPYVTGNSIRFKEGSYSFVRFIPEVKEDSLGHMRSSLKDSIRDMHSLYETQDENPTQTSFDSLFGLDNRKVYPTFEAQEVKYTTFTRSPTRVPERMSTILNKHNARPMRINEGTGSLLKVFSKEFFLGLSDGLGDPRNTPKYVRDESGLAKEEDAARSYDNFMAFIDRVEKFEPKAIYTNHVPWKQSRFGVNGIIDPQNSKLIRHHMGYQNHKRTYEPDDFEAKLGLSFAFAQALGIKIDTDSYSEIIEQMNNLIGTITTEDTDKLDTQTRTKRELYIEIISKLKAIDTLSQEEKTELEEQILVAVNDGSLGAGEGFLSYHGFVEMARAMEYVEDDNGLYGFRFKREPFTSDMVIEIDGKTNGFAFALLQLAGIDVPNPEENIKSLGHKVGLFFDEDTTSINQYAENNKGFADVYRTLGKEWMDSLARFKAMAVKDGKFSYKPTKKIEFKATLGKINGLDNLLGKHFADKIRQFSKKPVMTLLYGSGLPSSINEYVEEAVVAIYHKALQGDVTADQFANLGINLTKEQQDLLVNTPHEFILNETQEKLLRRTIYNVHGAALYHAVNTGFLSPFLDLQATLNQAANSMYRIFKRKYDERIKKAMAENNGLEISHAKKMEILEELKETAPIFKSHFSQDTMEGIYAMKRETVDSSLENTESKLVSQYREGTTKLKHSLSVRTGKDIAGTRSIAYANRSGFKEPGASPFVLMIHSLDAATMLEFLDGDITALNIHDAVIVSAQDFITAGKRINNAFLSVNQKNNVTDIIGSKALEVITEDFQASVAEADELLALKNPTDEQMERLSNLMVENEENEELIANLSRAISKSKEVREKVFTDLTAINQYANIYGSFRPTMERSIADEQYATSLGNEVGNKIVEILYEEQRLDDDESLGSGPDILNNFKPNRTEKVTSDNIQSLFQEFVHLDGNNLSDEHQNKLQNTLDLVKSLIGEVEVKLHEKANANNGRYNPNTKTIEMTVSNPLVGFTGKTASEVYVHEMVHAITHQMLKTGSSAQKRRIQYFYKVVADRIPTDWFVPPNATKEEREKALALHDYIFGATTQKRIKSKDAFLNIGRNDRITAGIDEFLAHALTNERLIEFINQPSIKSELAKGQKQTLSQTKAKSTVARALDTGYRYFYNLFQELLDAFVNRIVLRIDNSATAEAMLLGLTKQAAMAHTKAINKANSEPGFFTKANEKISDGSKKVLRKTLIKLGDRKNSKGDKNPLLAGLASAARAADKYEKLGEKGQLGINAINLISTFRRESGLYSDGILSTIAREMIGQNATNRIAYAFQRIATNVVDRIQNNTATTVGKFLRDSYTKELNKSERSSLGRVLLNSDLAALLTDTTRLKDMSPEQIEQYLADEKTAAERTKNFDYIRNVIQDDNYRQEEINRLEQAIYSLMGNHKPQAVHYVKMARSLGHDMTTGEMLEHLQFRNAYAISQLYGTDLSKTGLEPQAEVLIDKLASLVSLDYTDSDDRKVVSDIIDSELNDPDKNSDNNGVTKTLQLAAQVQYESLHSLFKGNKTAMVKGYTKETLDDRVDVLIAPISKTTELMEEGGYKLMSNSELGLPQDMYDTTGEKLGFFVSESAKTSTYQKQILSLHSNAAQGTTLQKMDFSVHGAYTMTGKTLQAEVDKITNSKQAHLRKQRMNPMPTNNNVHMRPVPRPDGSIATYAYTMSEETKHLVLDKQDMFDLALGNTAGAVIAKPRAEQMNRKAMNVLSEMYRNESGKNPKKYIRIAADSISEEHREYWNMLPYEAKQAAEEAFGAKEIYIADDMLRLFFGYRKKTASALVKGIVDRRLEKGKDNMMTSMLNHLAYLLNLTPVRVFEDFWQELVRMAKDAIVIKTGVVLVANMVSNAAVLAVEGMNILDVFSYQKEGWDAIDSYQKDTDELKKARLELATNKGLSTGQRKKIENQIARLQDSISRNPALDLITSGVYQTIVEDVSLEEETFSYKGSLERKFEPITEKVPQVIKDAGNFFFMTHDTRMYRGLRNATQKSDFVARYALHRHNLENGMNQQESINRIMDSFIDYETPTHPTIQYLNDMGLLMFTKFFFRIQKVLLRQVNEKTANVFLMFMLQGLAGANIPNIFDALGLDADNWQYRMYGPFDNLSAVFNGNVAQFGLVDGLGSIR